MAHRTNQTLLLFLIIMYYFMNMDIETSLSRKLTVSQFSCLQQTVATMQHQEHSCIMVAALHVLEEVLLLCTLVHCQWDI